VPDLTIECVDCGEEFVHDEGEQKWMRDKWGEEYAKPKRCPRCRKVKREAKKAKVKNGNGPKRTRSHA
jgi:NAD-dependent SIR2 family protein deacetylase